uniref:Uncharacterized protein n=1 Tax=Monopterus albus TaxID=43700 RepID=A0A3Q3IY70_MONAL
METQSQANSAAEKKKRVETIVASKGSSVRNDVSEKAVASSTTSNGIAFPHGWLNGGFILCAVHLCAPSSCTDSSKGPTVPQQCCDWCSLGGVLWGCPPLPPSSFSRQVDHKVP